MDFLSPELFIALGVAAAAGLMRGFAGVGSGMLMAPVFAILFGPVQTVAVIVLMEIVVTGQLLPGVRREIDWKVIAPMGAAAACLMPVGSWLLVSLDPDLIARGIALVVVAFSVLLMAGWRYGGRKEALGDAWRGRAVGRIDGVHEPRQPAGHGLPAVQPGCGGHQPGEFHRLFRGHAGRADRHDGGGRADRRQGAPDGGRVAARVHGRGLDRIAGSSAGRARRSTAA